MPHGHLDQRALSGLIGPQLARSLAAIAEPGAFATLGLSELNAIEARLAADPGVVESQIGESLQGRPIRMLSLGAGRLSVLAYGHPHPDEPLGASALAWLAERLATSDPALCGIARFHLVLCADPDSSAMNEGWGRRGTMEALLETVRPEHLAREIDYGFPVRWGPFEQPPSYEGALSCYAAARCLDPAGCGPVCQRLRLPAGTYPESRALARAIQITDPDLVVSLHDTVVGGCFSFLLEKPTSELTRQMLEIPGACGLPRQVGQKVDSGRPWIAGVPDLIREPRIETEARRFLRRPGVDPGLTYLGNVSAAQHLQSVRPGAQFLVPEAPHLTNASFGDQTPLGQTRRVSLSREMRVKGLRWCVRGEMVLPDGGREGLLYRMSAETPYGLPARPGSYEIPLSVGMLGVEAICLRRWAFNQTDELAQMLPEWLRSSDHQIAAERRAIRVRAHLVNDRSLRIFRLSPYTDRIATRAHAADFQWRWRIESARRPMQLARLIREEGGPKDILARARDLAGNLTAPLPSSLHTADLRPLGALSQLARIVATIQSLKP